MSDNLLQNTALNTNSKSSETKGLELRFAEGYTTKQFSLFELPDNSDQLLN